MDRVFLDAHVLFSATYCVETPLRSLFTLARANLVTSAYALEEAKRNLSSGPQQAELERLCHSVEVMSLLPPKGELSILGKLPENDHPILRAAISVRAAHLLSGDFKTFGRFLWAHHQRCYYYATSGLSQRAPRVIASVLGTT